MKLAITTAIMRPVNQLVSNCVLSHSQRCNNKHELVYRDNTPEDNLGVTGSLQWCYENTTAPIIAHLHSDVEIFEQGWDGRVLREFDDPFVGVVGMGGGTQLGHDDLYKTPYALNQLARYGYVSNTTDAEQHGQRFTDACDVAVLDGFCLVVRRDLIERAGGWPVKDLPFHMYDAWLACVAKKQGYRTRMVGVSCTHHGGATATTPAYQEWCQRMLGKSDNQVHTDAHRYIYDTFRKVLPICL